MAPPTPRHSGLQRQALALYREALRAARSQPLGDAPRAALVAYAAAEFRRLARVDRLDFQRVEHLLRQGRKKIDSLTSAEGGVSGFGVAGGGGGGGGGGDSAPAQQQHPRHVLAMVRRGARAGGGGGGGAGGGDGALR